MIIKRIGSILIFLTMFLLLFISCYTEDNNSISSYSLKSNIIASSNKPKIQFGSVNANHIFKNINIQNGFTNPVLIAGIPTFNGAHPGVVRVKKQSSNVFSVKFQEWLYLDIAHVFETIPYLIIEKGRYNITNNNSTQQIEAGTVNVSGNKKFANVNFQTSFSNNPLVFVTMNSYNGGETAALRIKDITVNGFKVALVEEESKNDGHLTETVGFLAVNFDGNNTISSNHFIQSLSLNNFKGYNAGLINHNWFRIPSLIDKELNEFMVKIEEEQSLNSEIMHLNENLAVLFISNSNNNLLFGQLQSYNGGDTCALRQTRFVPTVTTLLAPAGTINDSTPTYKWNAVSNTTHYILKVSDSANNILINTLYSAAQVNCASGTGQCSVTPVANIGEGARKWSIRTKNRSIFGNWSIQRNFNANLNRPEPVFEWSGPFTSISTNDEQAFIKVNNTEILPIFLSLNHVDNDQAFKFQLKNAIDSGIKIIEITKYMGSINSRQKLVNLVKQSVFESDAYQLGGYNSFDAFPLNLIIRIDLNNFDSVYRTEGFEVMKMQNKSGLTVNAVNPWYSGGAPWLTLSNEFINRLCNHLDELIKEFDLLLPGKIIGFKPQYLTESFSRAFFKESANNFKYVDIYHSLGSNISNLFYWTDYNNSRTGIFNQWMNSNTYPKPSCSNSNTCNLPLVRDRFYGSYGTMFYQGNTNQNLLNIAINRFNSDRIALLISALSDQIKITTNKKALALAYYGYSHELAPSFSSHGHFSFDKILDNSSLDGVTPPYSYGNARNLGQAFTMHGASSSPALHDKIWINEDDSASYIESYYCGQQVNDCHNLKVNSLEEYFTLIKRNGLTSALIGNGLYYFDLWNHGWFGNPQYDNNGQTSTSIWDTISNTIHIAESIDFNGAYSPEIAVFVDELSDTNTPIAGPLGDGIFSNYDSTTFMSDFHRNALNELSKIGAPVRHYLLSDLLNNRFPFSKTKLFIFLNTFRINSAIKQKIRNSVMTANKHLLFLYAPGLINETEIADVENISNLISMQVKRGNGASYLTTKFNVPLNGQYYYYGISSPVNPWFYIDTEASNGPITSLGFFTNNTSMTSVAKTSVNGSTVVYSVANGLPKEVFRYFASEAGVHLFTNRAGDVIEARGNTLMVHTDNSSNGVSKTINVPYSWRDGQIRIYNGAIDIDTGYISNTMSFNFFANKNKVYAFKATNANSEPVQPLSLVQDLNQSYQVSIDGNVQLTVSVDGGTGQYEYIWYQAWDNSYNTDSRFELARVASSNTTNTFNINNYQNGWARKYFVKVCSGQSCITSRISDLIIAQSQPLSFIYDLNESYPVSVDGNVQLTVTVQGGTGQYEYIWYQAWNNIYDTDSRFELARTTSADTADTFNINNYQIGWAREFFVKVCSGQSCITSRIADLLIIER